MSSVTCSVTVYLSVSYFPLSPPPFVAATALAPVRSRPSFFHHIWSNHAHGIRTISLHSPIIGLVAIYCTTVLCLFRAYSTISLNPASCIAFSGGGYSQLPSPYRCGCLPVIILATLCWNPPRDQTMQKFIIHISDLYISTTCTTTFKNIPDTLGMATSLISILVRWAQPFRAFQSFPTTNGQFLSDAAMILPKYLMIFPVSIGHY